MSVVRAAIDTLPQVNVQLPRLRDAIKEATQRTRSLQEELKNHLDSCKMQIADYTDEMMTFIMDTPVDSPQYAHDELLLHNMKERRHTLETSIEAATTMQRLLEADLATVLSRWEYHISVIARKEILLLPIMKEVTCTICSCVGPPVIPKWSCYLEPNHPTGRPNCFLPLCLHCVRDIMGFNSENDCQPTCRGCNTTYDQVFYTGDAYIINMIAMRMADAYINSENQEFRNFFGDNLSLNIIECNLCKMTFTTISDLHHHMMGDDGCVQCSYYANL